MEQRIVVIGAGQAGAALVAKLRSLGHRGPLTLIGSEPILPYQRPPLSKKYLMGDMAFDRLLLRQASFYEENNIDVRIDTLVTAIDRNTQTVQYGGESLPYDQLALTTGATPRALPPSVGGSQSGVYTVRNRADVDRMAHEFKDGRRLFVVGGGYIGLEAAAVAASRGLSVTLVETAERILKRVAAPETADFFRKLHTDHGVEIRESVGINEAQGQEGRVSRVVLSDGAELDIDFMIVGIGVTPETALAHAASLQVENGILVDGQCRTSDPAIFSAGDCAAFEWKGRRVRLESVQNAIDQAEHAAAVMLGETSSYVPHPWFWSDQYDCKLQIAGLNLGYDEVRMRDGSRPGGQSVWYFSQGHLIAIDAMNDPKAYMTGKRWIEASLTPDPAKISDTALDLRDLV